jgi:hypothetical protein
MMKPAALLFFCSVVACHQASPPKTTPPAAPTPSTMKTEKAEPTNCTPSSHPLADALTKESGKHYEAFTCASIAYTQDLALPGVVVRLSNLHENRYADTPTVPERLWSFVETHTKEIDAAAPPPRDAFYLDAELQQFIQRIPGTKVRAEGRIEVHFMGGVVSEVRISTMDLSKESAGDDWKSVKAEALKFASTKGLASPRLVRLPRSTVTRAHGRVIDVELSGIETVERDMRQTDLLVLRLAAQDGKVLSERIVPVQHRPPPKLQDYLLPTTTPEF